MFSIFGQFCREYIQKMNIKWAGEIDCEQMMNKIGIESMSCNQIKAGMIKVELNRESRVMKLGFDSKIVF